MKSLAILAAGAALIASPLAAQQADPIAQVEAQQERTQQFLRRVNEAGRL